ncbi:MAG TPA: hypothetical protein VM076_13100 [Gemmatimonadaceae bacterium]|nr:hypothetical protein [Gemmatimonadaceae bacterium]
MLIAAAVFASMLSSAKPHHPRHDAAVDSSGITLVEVQNDRKVPVTVYAQDSWGEITVGVVPADSTVTLRLRDSFVREGADIDFFVHPRGQPEEETGYMEVRRGERLGVLVPPRR